MRLLRNAQPKTVRFMAALIAAMPLTVGAQESTPDAAQILDRYIAVTGGKAAYEKLQNMLVEKTLQKAGSEVKTNSKIYRQAPDKLYQEYETPRGGALISGTNGTIAWQINPMQGARLLEDRNEQLILREAVFNPDLNWRKLYQTVEFAGLEEVEGQPCHKIELVGTDLYREARYYNIDSGLLVKIVRPMPGTPEVQYVFEDYKKVGDILVAHRMRQRINNLETVHTLTRVAFNTELPKGCFDVPAAVQALKDGGQ